MLHFPLLNCLGLILNSFFNFFFWQASVFKYHSNSENRSFLLIQWTSISVLKCMLIWLGLCWLKKQSFSCGTWCIDPHFIFKWQWQFWFLVPLCQRWSAQSSVRSMECGSGHQSLAASFHLLVGDAFSWEGLNDPTPLCLGCAADSSMGIVLYTGNSRYSFQYLMQICRDCGIATNKHLGEA